MWKSIYLGFPVSRSVLRAKQFRLQQILFRASFSRGSRRRRRRSRLMQPIHSHRTGTRTRPHNISCCCCSRTISAYYMATYIHIRDWYDCAKFASIILSMDGWIFTIANKETEQCRWLRHCAVSLSSAAAYAFFHPQQFRPNPSSFPVHTQSPTRPLWVLLADWDYCTQSTTPLPTSSGTCSKWGFSCITTTAEEKGENHGCSGNSANKRTRRKVWQNVKQ